MNGKRAHYASRANDCQDKLRREGFDKLAAQPGPALPSWLERLPITTTEERIAKLRAVELYTRFIFSALVDADRLDAEEDERKQNRLPDLRQGWRFGSPLWPPKARERFASPTGRGDSEQREEAVNKGASSDVLAVRQRVLDHCKTAAEKERGIFCLTVPTGGGKTLASVDFALRHIQAQNARTRGVSTKNFGASSLSSPTSASFSRPPAN